MKHLECPRKVHGDRVKVWGEIAGRKATAGGVHEEVEQPGRAALAHEKESAAAQAREPGLCHGRREAGAKGSIHSVTTGAQNCGRRCDRLAVTCCYRRL